MSVSGKVLIIDDEPTICQTLTRILQRAGVEVTSAVSGEQGLRFLETTDFDLVYLDIRMPGRGGLEVLQDIQARHPETPVVLFTAQPDIQSAVQALRRGAADYLLKPLKPEVILERTQTILENRRRERRKREIIEQIAALEQELKEMEASSPLPPAAAAADGIADRYLKRGRLALDLHTRRALVDGEAVKLPPASFDYLLVLARHAPEVVDYQTLAAEAQGYQVSLREAQELAKWHIHHIRQAIEPDMDDPRYVINVRGRGYRLVID